MKNGIIMMAFGFVVLGIIMGFIIFNPAVIHYQTPIDDATRADSCYTEEYFPKSCIQIGLISSLDMGGELIGNCVCVRNLLCNLNLC